ncbi:MAG: serine/threonine protein kinase [Chloroflexota bacterium]
MFFPPRVLGPYRLTEVIGREASVITYKGYRLGHERWLTITLIHRQATAFSPHHQERLRKMTRLRHASLLSVLDYGLADEQAYLVYDCIPAIPLGRRLAFGLDLRLTLDILQPLADALAHIHQQGLAHGQISLQSIVLAEGDWPLLADMGLTLLSDPELMAACTDDSPAHRQRLLQAQSDDIHALGAVLYEMLTGKSLSPVAEPAQEPTRPLGFFCPGIPPEIEAIFEKAVAAQPERRYARPSDLLHDLEQARASLFGFRAQTDHRAECGVSNDASSALLSRVAICR